MNISYDGALCADCTYWREDKEFKGLGSCGSEDVNNRLLFGIVDYFLIQADFGCKFFKKKEGGHI